MSTQKKSSTDKNEYEGRKDEYGGTMTGTGYGRQAEDKKEKEKETGRNTKKEKSEAGDNDGYEDSAKTNGFNEGQGGGIAHKNSEKG